jgi:hypothetical protein
VVAAFYRALKRAPTEGVYGYPRLKPGATVLTQASPAVRAHSNYATENRHCGAARFIAARQVHSATFPGGVAVVRTGVYGYPRLKPGATVLTQASPAVRAHSNYATANRYCCGTARSIAARQVRPATFSGGVAVVRTVVYGCPRLKPGATVLTQASPAVILSSDFPINSNPCAAIDRDIACSMTSPGGVAVVRTVAHGFSRGSRTGKYCEPALAGDRTVLA